MSQKWVANYMDDSIGDSWGIPVYEQRGAEMTAGISERPPAVKMTAGVCVRMTCTTMTK